MRTSARGWVWNSPTGSWKPSKAIERNPFGHAKVIGDARRALLKQFPYGLWFKIENDAIVIACLHHKRDIRLARERAAGMIEIPKKPES